MNALFLGFTDTGIVLGYLTNLLVPKSGLHIGKLVEQLSVKDSSLSANQLLQ